MASNTDYQLAKSIVDTLSQYEESTVNPSNVGNFRKYLVELVKKEGLGLEYSTKIVDVKKKTVRVNRIK